MDKTQLSLTPILYKIVDILNAIYNDEFYKQQPYEKNKDECGWCGRVLDCSGVRGVSEEELW